MAGKRPAPSPRRKPCSFTPRIETLEGRTLPSFMPAVNYDFGVGAVQGIAIGDFNNDGIPDLATANDANTTGGTVSIALGNGDATFQDAQNFRAGPKPVAIATGDFNNDGNLDVVVVNYSAGTMTVLLGNGDGTLQPGLTYDVGQFPNSVAVGDFNGDGNLDVAVANILPQNSTVTVLLGNGDGTFQAPVSYATGVFTSSVVVGDVNGDGIPDLVATNESQNGGLSVLLGNGDGTFQDVITTPGPGGYSVTLGDFNGDGILDAATGGDFNAANVYLGNGDGTFQTPAQGFGGDDNIWPIAIATGDFNNDGIADLVTVDHNQGHVRVMLGNGDGTFGNIQDYDVGARPLAVASGDLTGDGFQDLVVGNQTSHDFSVLLNAADWGPGPGGSPRAGASSHFTFTRDELQTNAASGPIVDQGAALSRTDQSPSIAPMLANAARTSAARSEDLMHREAFGVSLGQEHPASASLASTDLENLAGTSVFDLNWTGLGV